MRAVLSYEGIKLSVTENTIISVFFPRVIKAFTIGAHGNGNELFHKMVHTVHIHLPYKLNLIDQI